MCFLPTAVIDLSIRQRTGTRWTLTVQGVSVLELKARSGTPVMGPVMIRAGIRAGIVVKGLPVHKRAPIPVGVPALTPVNTCPSTCANTCQYTCWNTCEETCGSTCFGGTCWDVQ